MRDEKKGKERYVFQEGRRKSDRVITWCEGRRESVIEREDK